MKFEKAKRKAHRLTPAMQAYFAQGPELTPCERCGYPDARSQHECVQGVDLSQSPDFLRGMPVTGRVQ